MSSEAADVSRLAWAATTPGVEAGPVHAALLRYLEATRENEWHGPEAAVGNDAATSSAVADLERAVRVQAVKPGLGTPASSELLSSVDAVTTDDIILAGFAAANPGKLKVVGKPFSTEKYGVGLKKDDKAGRDAVNAAIEKAFTDGAWKAAFEKTVGPSGYPLPATPPSLEKY